MFSVLLNMSQRSPSIQLQYTIIQYFICYILCYTGISFVPNFNTQHFNTLSATYVTEVSLYPTSLYDTLILYLLHMSHEDLICTLLHYSILQYFIYNICPRSLFESHFNIQYNAKKYLFSHI